MEKVLNCIVCPLGCRINVKIEDGKVESVSGNTCPRGEEYARTECTNPMRVVTSTVRCSDGRLVAVKTDKAIPKNKVSDCMRIINELHPVLPISIGDVINEDVFGSRIVATSNLY